MTKSLPSIAVAVAELKHAVLVANVLRTHNVALPASTARALLEGWAKLAGADTPQPSTNNVSSPL
jgi:hypothetical protein